MSTTTRPAKTTTPLLTARTGACGARTRSGPCPCQALRSPQDVAGYRTCACGHTQHSHAAPAADLPLAG